MLVYQIKPQWVAPSTEQLNYLIGSQKQLDVYLEKFPRFVCGDRVRFKRPKRRPIEGTIIHVERDNTKIHWTNGVPQFLTIHLDKKNVINGIETVKANSKKLLYIGKV